MPAPSKNYCRGCLALALPFIAAATCAAPHSPAPDKPPLETITVIGEKTERSLGGTLSSVSVITEDELNALFNSTLTEVVSEVPNVVIQPGNVMTIRGAFGNGPTGGFSSITGGAKARVSTIIDGVAEPFVADVSGDSGIWDMQQVEVYRGPQSTTNGRNSIGGMVFIKTNDPSFEWQSSARLGYRNEEQYIDSAIMLSGPLVDDTLAFRLTAQQLDAELPSWDQAYGPNSPSYDLSQRDTTRLKGKLLWTPTGDFRALLSYSSNDEQGASGRMYYTAENPDPYEYKQIDPRDIGTRSDTSSLDIDYQLTETVSLDVLLSYLDYELNHHFYDANDKSQEQDLEFDEDSYTLDAKLNIGQAGHRASGFIGLAYFDRKQDFASSGRDVYSGNDQSKSKAIYGEFNYAFTERLRFIAGLRVEKEEQNRFFDFTTLATSNAFAVSKTFSLPKLALQYELNPDHSIGLSVREGYGSGGGAYSVLAREYYYFDEEEVLSYEFSWRGQLPENRGYLAANLFFNDYDGYQAVNALRTIDNMDKVTSWGAELEATSGLSDSLELTIGLGLLETKINKPSGDYARAKGNELSMAPNVTGNMGLRYTLNPAMQIAASARYVGEYFSDVDNTPSTRAGDYTLYRLSARYTAANWSLDSYINNLLDEEAITLRGSPRPPSAPDGYASIIDRRNIGLTFTYHFF